MKRWLLVFQDEDYAQELAGILAKKTDKDTVLEIITDPEYLDGMLTTLQTAELMVTDEQMYRPKMKKHRIRQLFLLSRDADEPDPGKRPFLIPDLYTAEETADCLTDSVYRQDYSSDPPSGGRGKIAVCCAVSGGSGKTMVAQALTECLSSDGCKAVLVDAQYIQTLGCLTDRRIRTREAQSLWKDRTQADLGHRILALVENSPLRCLPPFEEPLYCQGIPASFICDILNALRDTNEFDFIIADTDSAWDDKTGSLMQLADRLVFVIRPEEEEIWKLRMIQKNIILDKEKCIFLLNERDPETERIQDAAVECRSLFGDCALEEMPYLKREERNLQSVSRTGCMQRLEQLLLH